MFLCHFSYQGRCVYIVGLLTEKYSKTSVNKHLKHTTKRTHALCSSEFEIFYFHTERHSENFAAT